MLKPDLTATEAAAIQWGDVATWVTGASTLGLFVAAVYTAVYAYRSWRGTVVSGRRAQASLVAAWAEKTTAGEIVIRLSNRSPLPIYQLRLLAHGRGEHVEVEVPRLVDIERVVVPPGFDGNIAAVSDRDAQRTRGPFVDRGEIDVRGPLAEDFTVEITFRDAAGQAWQRDEEGVLAEVKAHHGSKEHRSPHLDEAPRFRRQPRATRRKQ